MAGIHRWSMMIYRIIQGEFRDTKYNSHIYRHGTSIFVKIIVNVSKPINNNNQIFWRLLDIIRFDMSSVLLASKGGFSNFCCIPYSANSYMEEL